MYAAINGTTISTEKRTAYQKAYRVPFETVRPSVLKAYAAYHVNGRRTVFPAKRYEKPKKKCYSVPFEVSYRFWYECTIFRMLYDLWTLCAAINGT